MTTLLTEEQMSLAFEDMIRSRTALPGMSHVQSFTKEVPCLEGRPDFVASPAQTSLQQDITTAMQHALATPSVASVLSLLKYRAPRTDEYLLKSTGLSRAVLRRAIATLSDCQLIGEIHPGQFVRTYRVPTDIELWAFELKIDNWQRALYQARRDLAFCHRATVVLSEDGARRAIRRLDRFRALGVGLFKVDMDSNTAVCVVPPRALKPESERHYLHALGKYMSLKPINID